MSEQKFIISRLAKLYTEYKVEGDEDEIEPSKALYNQKVGNIRERLQDARVALLHERRFLEREKQKNHSKITEYEQAEEQLCALLTLFARTSILSDWLGALSFEATLSRMQAKKAEAGPDPIQATLNQIDQANQIPFKGVKTTWFYELLDLYSLEERKGKHAAIIALGVFVPGLLLLVFLGTGLWMFAAAAGALALLVVGLGVITKFSSKILTPTLAHWDKTAYEAYQQSVLDCFNVELQLTETYSEHHKAVMDRMKQEVESDKNKNIEKKKPTKTTFTPPIISQPLRPGETVIDPNDVPQHQQNYTAVRALSMINFRLEQCSSMENFTLIKNLASQLQIKNRGSTDNSCLECTVVEKDAQQLLELGKVIGYLFPDIPNICISYKRFMFVISHRKTKELIYAGDFDPQKFLDDIKSNDDRKIEGLTTN